MLWMKEWFQLAQDEVYWKGILNIVVKTTEQYFVRRTVRSFKRHWYLLYVSKDINAHNIRYVSVKGTNAYCTELWKWKGNNTCNKYKRHWIILVLKALMSTALNYISVKALISTELNYISVKGINV